MSNLIAAIGIDPLGLEDTMEHMLWMGDSLMNLGFLQTKEEARRLIERVTAADILRVAREIIDWANIRFAAVGPQSAKMGDKIREMVSSLK